MLPCFHVPDRCVSAASSGKTSSEMDTVSPLTLGLGPAFPEILKAVPSELVCIPRWPYPSRTSWCLNSAFHLLESVHAARTAWASGFLTGWRGCALQWGGQVHQSWTSWHGHGHPGDGTKGPFLKRQTRDCATLHALPTQELSMWLRWRTEKGSLL